jgi:hypothetical protein
MRSVPASLTWKNGTFLLRLLASYLLVPIVPPVLMLMTIFGTRGMATGDWFGIILLYGAFGLAAMLALGTPLLAVYLWLGLTDLISFMAGGGVCAGITAYAMTGRSHDSAMVYLFTILGTISGAIFRLILFGAQPVSRSNSKAPSR